MSKRIITENWYRFLKEVDETGPDIFRAKEEIAQLEAMIESLEEAIRDHKARISFLQQEIGFDEYTASQIKEDKDG